MVALFDTLVNYDSKRYICAVIKTLLLDSVLSVLEIPVLVNHTAYTSGRKLSDVLVIVKSKCLGVDNALPIFLVELLEISLCSGSGVVVDSLMCSLVNYAAAVVGITVKEEGSILKAEISPVICEDLIADVGSAVLHCGVSLKVSLDNIEIFIKCFDLGIACPLENSCLNPECFIVMYCTCVIHINISELRNDVNVTVCISDLIPFSIGVEILYIRIVVPILVDRDKGTCINKSGASAGAYDKVGVFAACDHNADSFLGSLTCEPCFLALCADLFGNYLLDPVVRIDLISGNGEESCKLLDLSGGSFCSCISACSSCSCISACSRSISTLVSARSVSAACHSCHHKDSK